MKIENIIVNKKKLEVFIKNGKSKSNYAFIFLNGINAEPEFINIWNHDIFKNNTLITFNNIAHFNNPEKNTSNLKKYVRYTEAVIEEIKKLKPLHKKKTILIGESFGASLGLIISKNNNSVCDLFYLWNAPTKISKNKQMKNQLSTSLKTLFTFLFNIETYTIGYFDPRLTSNKLVKRINEIKPKIRVSTKLNLVCWKTMKKTKKILRDGVNDNVYLTQSFDDILCDVDFFKKIPRKNIFIFENGCHVLSVEPEYDKLLFDNLLKIIKEKKW